MRKRFYIPHGDRFCVALFAAVAIVVIPLIAPLRAQDRSQTSPKDTLRQVFEAISEHDLDAANAFYAADFVSHTPYGDTPQVEPFRDTLAWIQSAMPDLQIQIKLLIADDTFVFSRIVVVGTFEDDLIMTEDDTTVPATGQQLMLPVHCIVRFDYSGSIAEEWVAFDNFSFLSQLGVLPLGRVMQYLPEVAPESAMREIPIDQAPLDTGTLETVVLSFEDIVGMDDMRPINDVMTSDSRHWERGTPYALDEWQSLFAQLHETMPDMQLDSENMITEGNLAAVYYRIKGTMTSGYTFPDGLVLAPSGGSVDVPSITLLRLNAEGKIVETWNEYDYLGLLAQMTAGPGA